MFEVSSTTEILAQALDACGMRQAVYSANIANANVEGYHRLEVQFDAEAMADAVRNAGVDAQSGARESIAVQPQIVQSANSTVKLDEEIAAMSRNALRYQTLLGAYERSASLLQMAVHEGRS